jgi:hypothetical protein
MKFERFVELVSKGEIYFAPLSSYIETDPFEGYLPAIAMDAHAEIMRNLIIDIEAFIKSSFTDDERKTMQPNIDKIKTLPSAAFITITRCSTVSCWHANEVESEAMWRLYSRFPYNPFDRPIQMAAYPY